MRQFLLSLSVLIVGAILTIRPAVSATTPPAQEWTMLRQIAGTIKNRDTGDLRAFGERYNPRHAATLTKNVAAIIARLKRQHNGVLP